MEPFQFLIKIKEMIEIWLQKSGHTLVCNGYLISIAVFYDITVTKEEAKVCAINKGYNSIKDNSTKWMPTTWDLRS